MMRGHSIGVITDEISQELAGALDLAEEFSLDGVEIRSVWDRGPFALTMEDAKRIRDLTRARGLSVCGISAPFYKCAINDPEERKAHLAGLEHCIRLAELWETPIIRGFSFWKEGSLAELLPQIAEAYQAPAEMAARHGITLALESDPSVNAVNGGQLAQLVDAVGSPAVQALWDPGNDLYAPLPERPYPEGYEKLRGRIAHVHLKDARRTDGQTEGCCFGAGEVDWKGQLAALERDGYQGWLVMETHYRLASVLSEEELKRPGGAAFSAGGYEPTRRCLAALREMLEG